MRSRLLAIALLAAGCTPDICARHSDCATGLVCTAAGQCAKPPVDAGGDGTTDASAASMVDAASPDAAVDGQPIIEGPIR
jgi:hypothetical protein